EERHVVRVGHDRGCAGVGGIWRLMKRERGASCPAVGGERRTRVGRHEPAVVEGQERILAAEEREHRRYHADRENWRAHDAGGTTGTKRSECRNMMLIRGPETLFCFGTVCSK